jgi:hypothetical protein
MPLTKSSSKPAFVSNLKAELAAGKPRDQSLAIAYSVKRKNRADGGAVHVGPIQSVVAGRTDHLPLDVPAGAYVIPADVVSGLGQGNTSSGHVILSRMFPEERADGGSVPIMAAGGEHVISPGAIRRKFGELNHGHKILDKWVVNQRKKTVNTLKKLPGPARN